MYGWPTFHFREWKPLVGRDFLAFFFFFPPVSRVSNIGLRLYLGILSRCSVNIC